MGGERYCFLRLRRKSIWDEKTITISEVAQATYTKLLTNTIQPLLQSSGASYETLEKGFKITQSDTKFSASFLPLQLSEWTEVGWADRRYGTFVNPNKKIVQPIIDCLYKELREVFIIHAEDCVHEDLYPDAYYHNDDDDDDDNK
jgi:hypothetical protein